MDNCGYCWFYDDEHNLCKRHNKTVFDFSEPCKDYDDDYDERQEYIENFGKNILT